MKHSISLYLIICIQLPLFFPFIANGQNVYVYEYRESQDRFLVEVSANKTYETKVGNYIDWYVNKTGEVIGGSSFFIIKQKEQNTDTLLNVQGTDSINEILRFAGSGNTCIIVTYEDFIEFERYYNSMKLYFFNVETLSLRQLDLPDSLNFFNISLSPDCKKILFTHISNFDSQKRFNSAEIAYLLFHDTESKKLISVDSARHTDNEWFKAIPYWRGNRSFLYYKKTRAKSLGKLFSYCLENAEIESVFEVPFDNVDCFSYWNKEFFFIQNSRLVSFDIEGNEKLWYESEKGHFLQSRIIIR